PFTLDRLGASRTILPAAGREQAPGTGATGATARRPNTFTGADEVANDVATMTVASIRMFIYNPPSKSESRVREVGPRPRVTRLTQVRHSPDVGRCSGDVSAVSSVARRRRCARPYYSDRL